MSSSATDDPSWVRRTDVRLGPDPTRVVSTLFLPGQELLASGESRSAGVLARVLGLTDGEVDAELDALARAFARRHRDLDASWDAHFALMRHRLTDVADLTPHRRRLIGAYFTQEFAVEGAALFNPTLVPHPDQRGVAAGATRFVMTVRAVGEGHVSSMGLRTGVIDAHDDLTFDPPPSVGVLPATLAAPYSREAFQHRLDDLGGHLTNADFVLDALPPTFDRNDLDRALDVLRAQRLTRGAAERTIARLEWIADCTYQVEYPSDSAIGERVLLPHGASESHGVEDVRMVRFTAPDGEQEYLASYTAFDGREVSMQLLRTSDFTRFTATPLSGPGARNKGLALFPRQVGDRYLALSRADRETNSVTTSSDLLHWEEPVVVQRPAHPWELVQLGNCGSPIETESGWVVLTHGVGPMRTYCIGALLLDLDDPIRVRGRLARPLLTPAADERSGYVPNVVYSCGAMLHGRTLVLPYGCSDSTIRIALADLDALIEELHT